MQITLTESEQELLVELYRAPRFPIVRLELHNSEEPELVNTALNYVRLTDPADSMEAVKARAELLRGLMEKGLVFIDYTTCVWVAGDYDAYYRSNIYKMLCHMVMESAGKPGFVFNLPYMRKGYASLTRLGEKVAARL